MNKSIDFYENSVLSVLKEHDVKYSLVDDVNNEVEMNRIYLNDYDISLVINHQTYNNSNKFHRRDRSVDKKYHYQRYLDYQNDQKTLFQLYDWDFDSNGLRMLTKQNLIHQFTNQTKIDISTCEIKEIPVKLAKTFLSVYDIKGYSNSRFKYGVYHNDQLIAVVIFSSVNSNNKRYDFELKRWAVKYGLKIDGLLEQVTKRLFEQHEDVNCIYSYSDNDIETGQYQLDSNFTFVSETGPSLRFVSRDNTKSIDTYLWNIMTSVTSEKSVVGADRLLKGLSLDVNTYNLDQYIEEELTNRDGIHKGYDRIYTSGSKKWEISREDLNL